MKNLIFFFFFHYILDFIATEEEQEAIDLDVVNMKRRKLNQMDDNFDVISISDKNAENNNVENNNVENNNFENIISFPDGITMLSGKIVRLKTGRIND